MFLDKIVKQRLFVSLFFLLILILFHAIKELTNISFLNLGILPLKFDQGYSILTHVFVHKDWAHLLSNLSTLTVFLVFISYYFPQSFPKIFLGGLLLTGFGIFLFGREGVHIGASGLVYNFGAFIFFSGIIRWEPGAIALSLLITFLYSGIIYGLFPVDSSVSWEGHLSGAVSGIILAILLRSSDKKVKYDWENEPDEEKELKISYKDQDFLNQ